MIVVAMLMAQAVVSSVGQTGGITTGRVGNVVQSDGTTWVSGGPLPICDAKRVVAGDPCIVSQPVKVGPADMAQGQRQGEVTPNVPTCVKGQTLNPGESCRVFFNGVPYISTVSPGMGKPITVGQGPGWGNSKGSVIPAARAGEPIWFVTAWNPKASFYQPRAWFLSHAACEAAAAVWKGPRPYGQRHLRPAVCGGMGYGVPALLEAQP